MILPMRFRILHLMSVNKSLTLDGVMAALKPEYGSEGQYKESMVNLHLQSMRAVGLIEVSDAALEGGKLKETFRITDYGKDRLKYLPRDFKN